MKFVLCFFLLFVFACRISAQTDSTISVQLKSEKDTSAIVEYKMINMAMPNISNTPIVKKEDSDRVKYKMQYVNPQPQVILQKEKNSFTRSRENKQYMKPLPTKEIDLPSKEVGPKVKRK